MPYDIGHFDGGGPGPGARRLLALAAPYTTSTEFLRGVFFRE